MKYLVIDAGSSFIKSAILDLDSRLILDEDRRPSPARRPDANPRRFEVPAEAFSAVAGELIQRFAHAHPDISGILIGTQMHGFVYTTPGRRDLYVSWQDSRCLDGRREGGGDRLGLLREALPPPALERTGMPLKPSLALCNLFAMFDEDPSLPRNGVLHTLGSYITGKLGGDNVCHLTNAAALGLADITASGWNRPILEKAGLGEVVLPGIAADDFQVCGSLRLRGREIPIHPDYGDQQVAVLGCLPRPGDAILNISTGGQVVTLADSLRPGPHETRPYFENRLIRTIADLPSGRCLQVLIDFAGRTVSEITGEPASPEAIWRAVRAGFASGAGGLKVDAGFYPRPGRPAGGSVSGVTHANLTLSNLVSAAFRDMAETYLENLAGLCGAEAPRRLICSGGVSWRNPELVEMIGGRFGGECVLSPIPDEAMSGFFRLALACAGVSRRLDDHPELTLRRREGQG